MARLRSDGGGVCLLCVLQFGEHSVQFSAISEDDATLTVQEVETLPEAQPEHEQRNAIDDNPWNRFVGSSVRWGRRMTNHHGYVDGISWNLDRWDRAPLVTALRWWSLPAQFSSEPLSSSSEVAPSLPI